ncbi:hypothetical protein CXZ05_20280 [Arthrobacter sp. AFG20]|nr:hypothetical protein CXZ05_20280 [Arthrobacter sp. AFG20]
MGESAVGMTPSCPIGTTDPAACPDAWFMMHSVYDAQPRHRQAKVHSQLRAGQLMQKPEETGQHVTRQEEPP